MATTKGRVATTSGMAARSEKAAQRWPRWAKVLLTLGVVLVLVVASAVTASVLLARRYENNIHRADLLGSHRSDGRDLGKVAGPLNILIIGSDTRAKEDYDPDDPSSTQASVPGERSDVLMVLHVNRDMKAAQVISIPRDTYVTIPTEASADDNDELWQGGTDRANTAYAWGGAPLAVATVEQFTGLTMDHVVVVDFASIRTITDAVGGVEVLVDQEVTDPRSRRTFVTGRNHLDGRAAEDYVRQRYELPGGDFDRIKRQHQYLRSLLDKLTGTRWLHNPKKFDALMMAATSSLTVDTSMPVRSLAFALRSMSADQVTFITIPLAGEEIVDGIGYVALPDLDRSQQLFGAVRNDDVASYLAANPANDVTHGA